MVQIALQLQYQPQQLTVINMKKITKNGKEYVVLEKTKVIEEEIAVEDIQEKISALNANIVAYNATVADWEKQKKELEDYLK